ncbi:MAG: hypothetical protein KAR31_01840 [Candidatus Omnitrophica bacterium]|nr:hypothetical protein [Candidatus Omnitrophota bacterium]
MMGEPASKKLTKLLVLFVVGVLLFKNATSSGIFEAKDHKGKGFYVKIPEGWKKVKQQKDVVYPEGVQVVMFIPKEINVEYEVPDVYISIFTKKLSSPIWIEDEFPEILSSIKKGGYKIMDKGEIKIDDRLSAWVVYHDKKTPALVLEFYMVTDNSMFYKIQYSAHPDKFNKQRPAFEELKVSFKFRFSLY